MPEPTASILGVKTAFIVASFVGSVCSLSYVAKVGPVARVSAVCVGTAAGCFVGPAVAVELRASYELSIAICWAIGFFSLAVLPAIQVLGARVPGEAWDMIKTKIGGPK